MAKSDELNNVVATNKIPGHAIPDAHGWVQDHPDARGFAPGKVPEAADGKWRSDHPDAHGWHHSSSG